MVYTAAGQSLFDLISGRGRDHWTLILAFYEGTRLWGWDVGASFCLFLLSPLHPQLMGFFISTAFVGPLVTLTFHFDIRVFILRDLSELL